MKPMTLHEMCFGGLSPNPLIGTKRPARRPSAPRVLAAQRAAMRRVTGGGAHPLGVPMVVLTYQPHTDWPYPGAENFSSVTDGIEAAVALAQQVAGEKNVGVAANTIARRCLEAGLLDEVVVDLVPIVMGKGGPYSSELPEDHPQLLADPTTLTWCFQTTGCECGLRRRQCGQRAEDDQRPDRPGPQHLPHRTSA